MNLSLGRRPIDLASECALSYTADEMLEVGLETARSGQGVTTFRNLPATLVDLLGAEIVMPAAFPRLSGFDDGLGSTANGEGIPRRLGRLVEPPRTNAFTFSQDLSNAAWTKANATVATDTTKGPDQVTAAYKVKEDNTAAARHGVTRATPALTNSTRSAFSFSARAAERTWLYVRTIDKSNTARSSWVNLATGAVGTKDSGHVIWVRYRVGGFYRIAVSFDASTGATAPSVEVYTATGDNVATFTGVTGSGIYLTDLQFETDGKWATSFIPTAAATVARPGDEAKFTLQIPIPDSLTVLIELARPAFADLSVDLGNPAYCWGWGSSPGAGSRLGVYFDTASRIVVALLDTSGSGGGTVSVSAAIPANRTMQFCAQFQNLRTAGKVRLDVGPGFGAFSGVSSVGLTSMAGYLFGIGELGYSALYECSSEVTILRAYPGIRTLPEMLRTR